MQRLGLCIVFFLASVLATKAQSAEAIVSASTVQSHDGLLIQTVQISQDKKSLTAEVYRPDTHDKIAATVFSHSKIKSSSGETDLTPLAVSIARSGSIVMVFQRTLLWQVAGDDDVNRDGGKFILAAEKWLLLQPEVDQGRFAYIGPRFHDPEDDASLMTGRYPLRPEYHVPVGEPAQQGMIADITSPERQMEIVHYLERHLRLKFDE
jgi:hypothetical protein